MRIYGTRQVIDKVSCMQSRRENSRRDKTQQTPGKPKNVETKGVRKRVGVKIPLEFDILQNLITCTKEINCLRIFCLLICQLNANTTE